MDNNNIEKIKATDPYFEDIKAKSSFQFDFLLWVFRILKSWYLFAFTIPFFLGIAYLDNLSWVPSYNVTATLMLENKGTNLINVVPLGNILRNDKNQAILIESFEMTKRTVESLPQKLHIDYSIADRFRTLNLYSNTPVRVDTIYSINQDTYNKTFQISPVDADHCRISIESTTEEEPVFSIVVPFGKIIDDKNNFRLKLSKTSYYQSDFKPFTLRFLTDDNLMALFGGQVFAGPKPNSSDMSVSMGGPVPGRDIDYLNVLLDEFQEYNLSLKNEQANKTLVFIDQQMKIIKDSLSASREALSEFQNKTGVYGVTSTNLRQQIKAQDEQRDFLSIFEKSLLAVTDQINQNIVTDKELFLPIWMKDNQIPGLNELLDQLSPLIKDYNNLLVNNRNIREKNPLYRKKLSEINEARRKIIDVIKQQQLVLQSKKEKMLEYYQDAYLQVENLPLQEKDFLEYERTFKMNENFEQYLTLKRREVLLQRESNVADNSIWERPRMVGGVNNEKQKREKYLFNLFLAFVLPLVFIVLKEEILNNKINSKEECEKLSAIPVVGTIENVSSKLKKGSYGLVRNFPKSSFAESFRNIRVRLEYFAKRENNISVMITSAEPADGKTFIATNIASIYQLTGKKVVIIDLDLRRPAVAKSLQLDSSKGVSNYLIGQVSLEDIIQSVPDIGFDVIPAGTLPPNPSELIKTEKTKELINILKTMYDYVVVDCSPVGLVSDAYILSKYVDVNLFVVRRAKTNRAFFKSVINQMRVDGVSNLGVILNDVKGREGYYGTSRYYGNSDYYIKRNSYYHNDYFEE